MSSDVKIPNWVRDEAFSLLSDVQMKDVDFTRWDAVASLDRVALALLAAEQRGRKAGLEEAAKVALTRSPDDDNLDWQVRQQVAAAIRSLGEKA